MLAAAGASLVDYAVNSGLVATFVSLRTGVPIRQVARELRIGRLSEFLVSYFGLGLVGLSLAILYKSVGVWALPAILAPLLFARQMFFRSQALEEAHKELQDPRAGTPFALERHGRGTSRRTTPDRRVPPRRPRPGAVPALHPGRRCAQAPGEGSDGGCGYAAREDPSFRSKRRRTGSVRSSGTCIDRHSVRRDSRKRSSRSPRRSAAIPPSVSIATSRTSNSPLRSRLLVYHIAREGVMNALKHAQPRDVWIAVLVGGRRHRAQPEGQRGWLRH